MSEYERRVRNEEINREIQFYKNPIEEKTILSTTNFFFIKPNNSSKKARIEKFNELKRDILLSVGGPREWRPYPKLISSPYRMYII